MDRSRLASSIKGRFSASDKARHSLPSRLEISELCIFGFCCAIFRRCPRDQTMNAFIGRLTCSPSSVVVVNEVILLLTFSSSNNNNNDDDEVANDCVDPAFVLTN